MNINDQNVKLEKNITDNSRELNDARSQHNYTNIVIAEILEILPHPNADRLRLAKVSDGANAYSIVCGAPNIEVGQKVPLAKIGAIVGETVIAEATIRGEISQGMLCSEHELGLSDDHYGILILDPDSIPGESFALFLKSNPSLYSKKINE